MLLVAIIALLLYGGDLPRVAREWGKTFNEFRRHLSGIRDELNDAIYAEPERPRLEHHPAYHAPPVLPSSAPASTASSDNAPTAEVADASPTPADQSVD